MQSSYLLAIVGLKCVYLVPLEAEGEDSIEYWHDLEIWVKGSFKTISFESLGTVSYSPSIATITLHYIMALSSTVFEILVEKRQFFIPPAI